MHKLFPKNYDLDYILRYHSGKNYFQCAIFNSTFLCGRWNAPPAILHDCQTGILPLLIIVCSLHQHVFQMSFTKKKLSQHYIHFINSTTW